MKDKNAHSDKYLNKIHGDVNTVPQQQLHSR